MVVEIRQTSFVVFFFFQTDIWLDSLNYSASIFYASAEMESCKDKLLKCLLVHAENI